ncbi:DUF2161 family putative PD-(D/E)XK-type phosphodiesterase [Sphingomonas metalli]|jgi:hypothetical protein|nr:DUF2161 family putative PD-(D/E)XK-type phosphodiesterase [Sphingomonas metalli]
MTLIKPVSETTLYAPIKRFLERHGFEVKGEICGCDIVGLAPGEPPLVVVTELKLSFSLELLLQAVERTRSSDIVYVAVPATRRGRDQDRRVHRLCRLLGLGLLAVDLRLGTVTVLAEPAPYRPRPNLPQRRRLVAEHRRRKGDPTQGGLTRQPIMTAYRQRTIACAQAMREGPKRPRDLRGLAKDAGAILLRNVYGWFERVEKGLYALSESGRLAIGESEKRSSPTPEQEAA